MNTGKTPAAPGNELKELDLVEVTLEVPGTDVRPGDQGTIVHVYRKPAMAYEVEFPDTAGRKGCIVSLAANQVRAALDWNAVRQRTITVEELMRMVALFHDRHGLPGEHDEPPLAESVNREYTRGQFELLMDAAGLPQELQPEMARQTGIDWRD